MCLGYRNHMRPPQHLCDNRMELFGSALSLPLCAKTPGGAKAPRGTKIRSLTVSFLRLRCYASKFWVGGWVVYLHTGKLLLVPIPSLSITPKFTSPSP